MKIATHFAPKLLKVREMRISPARIGTIVAGVLLGAGGTLALIETGHAVSVSVIATLLAAGAAVIGVLITNAAHEQRQRLQLAHDTYLQRLQLEHDREQTSMQLKHDRDTARLERELDYKKAVYIDAASAISQVAVTFVEFCDPRKSADETTTALRDKSAPITKLSLVSDETTEAAALKFYEVMSDAIHAIYPHHGALCIAHEQAALSPPGSPERLSLSAIERSHRAKWAEISEPLTKAGAALHLSLRRELRGFVAVDAER